MSNKDIAPFSSEGELIDFAQEFLNRNRRMLNRYINICLKADKNGDHAYFPALMTCFGSLEMLTELYKGKIQLGASGVFDYVSRFMDRAAYSDKLIKLSYEGMRHKIAHQAHPNFVTTVSGYSDRFVWRVSAGAHRPPIKYKAVKNRKLKRFSPPWDVKYDHILSISIPSFKKDIDESFDKYFEFLTNSTQGKVNFVKRITKYFPP